MSLELKKKKLEYSRVSLAREELEVKVAERQEEIARMQEYIVIQSAKEDELLKQIAELSSK